MSSSIAAGSSAVAFTTPTKRVQAVGASEAGPSRRPAGASPAYVRGPGYWREGYYD
jgi:hypothetical protein